MFWFINCSINVSFVYLHTPGAHCDSGGSYTSADWADKFCLVPVSVLLSLSSHRTIPGHQIHYNGTLWNAIHKETLHSQELRAQFTGKLRNTVRGRRQMLKFQLIYLAIDLNNFMETEINSSSAITIWIEGDEMGETAREGRREMSTGDSHCHTFRNGERKADSRGMRER